VKKEACLNEKALHPNATWQTSYSYFVAGTQLNKLVSCCEALMQREQPVEPRAACLVRGARGAPAQARCMPLSTSSGVGVVACCCAAVAGPVAGGSVYPSAPSCGSAYPARSLLTWPSRVRIPNAKLYFVRLFCCQCVLMTDAGKERSA
jgi:hypothetical protein